MDFLFLAKVIYFYVLALVLAMLEIQIEGMDGWAAKLPTWRVKPGSGLDKFFKKIAGQKDLTGYHTALMVFLLLFAHWPFVWSGSWNMMAEFELLAIFFMFTSVWDFLWFVLNPRFSLRKFNKERVWWHKKWWGKIPVDYYVGVIGSLILLAPELMLINPVVGIYKMVILLGVNLALVSLTVIFYPRAY